MESDDEWDEFAMLLQMEEWNKSTDGNTKSHDTPDFQTAADQLGLGRRLSQEQKQQSEELLIEQQLLQDEAFARQLEQSLQTGDGNEVEAQFNPDLQATAADQQNELGLEFYNALSEVERRHSEKFVTEQQRWQEVELAWRTEHGSFSENQLYDLFFAESTDDQGYVGVGCVIKDADGHVVFEHREFLGFDISHYLAEYNALINGLQVARSIGLRHISAYGNRPFIYWEVRGDVQAPSVPEQLNAVHEQIKDLGSFNLNCVSRTENQDAIKLAKYAAEHAPRIKLKSGVDEDSRTRCFICLENIFPSDVVCQKECRHTFCSDCLSQHVETEISDGKVPVRCPKFVDCVLYMDDKDCKPLVSPQVFETYSARLTEATISDIEKVYCPFPGCSALMCRARENRTDMYAASSSRSTPGRTNIGSAECMECHRLFCVECHVPWHADLSCEQYQNLPPDERDAETRKLFDLAEGEKWRRCGNCRSLIILAEGCFHMTCRCGNEFCYTCGVNYQGKKKMCQCDLFSDAQPANGPLARLGRLFR